MSEEEAGTGAGGLVLLAVVRGGEETLDVPGLETISHEGIAAVLRPVPPGELAEGAAAHHAEIERFDDRGSVVPAPPGIVFGSRAGVAAFLEARFDALEEALALCEGCREHRLHLRASGGTPDEVTVRNLSSHLYAELRRIARAATPLSRERGGLFSAAFLVERENETAFSRRARDLGSLNPSVTTELTGPWPAYDFVHFHEA